ncbi:DUF3179 domain-containing (seleno)protein [uncultured Imperialibacter sp.]|uniref:DUF3179 domain-containing (seleno)protein n=1 Tax=uncultured Imperialibacter sp. TaxID=1672639 RepID=UPI0030DBF404
MKTLLLVLGFFTLIVAEILKVYLIMPFPGSQQMNSIDFAYFMFFNIGYFRLAGLLMIAYPAWHFLKTGKKRVKLLIGTFIVLYLGVFYAVNFRMLADKIFYQPNTVSFVPASQTGYEMTDLVLGVEINGESKAYPIENIGYHHQVRDTVGGTPVIVTYCTVCRTGRIFSPEVNGTPETFRLVGMDHFNAMFEDSRTRSWWRQVNGEAVAGPLTGTTLPELPSEQMALGAWLNKYPESLVLQPDTAFLEKYENLKNYDEGTSESKLTGRDTASWADKSWVIGVTLDEKAKAYDWNELIKTRLINDTISSTSLLVALEPDSLSFHAWERDTLVFSLSDTTNFIIDNNTGSEWNWKGECVRGMLSGAQLKWVPAYQEFWHSWKTFHHRTRTYRYP